MEFKDYLRISSRQLDKEIQNILYLWLKDIEKIDRKLVPLAKEFIKSNSGGKGIRGALVKLGYGLTGSKVNKEILKIGAAYEILHTSILVHDDIIDQSPTRRGKKSLYKSIGTPEAITLGDLGFFLATKIIAESSFSDKNKNLSLKLFSKTMIDTAAGQLLDIKKGNQKTLMLLKTAYYTISAPLQLGAVLGGGEKKLLELLGLLGENLGIAYQIQDDILDGEVSDFGQSGVKYVAVAKKLIPKITSNRSFGKLLEEMADYVIQRIR